MTSHFPYSPIQNQRKRDLLAYFEADNGLQDRPTWLNASFRDNDRKFMRFLVPRGKRVLELGCGSGDLLAALDAYRKREGLLFSSLLVTDINDQSSLLLVQGADAFLQKIDYPQRSPHVWELAGVVSRKKQLLPYLLHCLAQMDATKL